MHSQVLLSTEQSHNKSLQGILFLYQDFTMKNLPVLPLIALAVACCLFGIAYSDAKVKSPSALLMCLIFILLAGIGYWIQSMQPCDKSKPGVEEQALEKLRNLSPSTPNWLQTLLNKIKFWWNSEDIDDLKDKDLLKERNNSVPDMSELDNKLNNSPNVKSKPGYNSKDDRNNTPVKGRSQSLADIGNDDNMKPAFSSPTQDGKFESKFPTKTDGKNMSVNSLYSSFPDVNRKDNDPKSARPSSKPSVDNWRSASKLPPSLSMNDSLSSAEIGIWYLDSPQDRKKPGQTSTGKDKKPNCRREIIITAVGSTLITIAVIGAFAGLYALFPEFFAKIWSFIH